MPEGAKSSLFGKLAHVMGEVGRVQKNGRNEHHGYSYVTETDLVEAVRSKLAEQGIAYFFSVLSMETREMKAAITNKGTGGYDLLPAKGGSITEVMVEATFADADTGQTFAVQGVGAGQDAGDKGVYKALTGAQKYILMKTFMVATGDDPEGDSKVDKANAEGGVATRTLPPPKATKAEAKTEAKTEARDHGPLKKADGTEEEDPMTKVLPGGPFKGKTIGSLNLAEARRLIEGDEDGKGAMPAANTWTKWVKQRHDYLKAFETMPEALKETANELDLAFDKTLDKDG